MVALLNGAFTSHRILLSVRHALLLQPGDDCSWTVSTDFICCNVDTSCI